MNKYMKYVTRAMSITGILMTQLPAIVADGKISVEEMSQLIVSICQACGWKVELEIPDSLKGAVVGATIE